MNPESDHYSRAIQQRAARRREARRRRQRKVALIKALLLLCLIAGLIFLASRLFGNGEEQPSPSPPPRTRLWQSLRNQVEKRRSRPLRKCAFTFRRIRGITRRPCWS